MASDRLPYEHASMLVARLMTGCATCMTGASVGLVPQLIGRGVSGIAGAVLLVLLTLFVAMVAADLSGDLGIGWELQTRRRFRAVCREKGLTTKDDKGRLTYPQLSKLAGGGGVMVARIRPLLGQSLADWERAAPAFALAYAVPGVRFQDNSDGTIRLQAGYRPLEARSWRGRLDENTDGVDWSERLACLPVALTEGGRPYLLPFLGGHSLIVGITGSGKGSVIWALIFELMPAMQAGVVRLWAIDPKRLELAQGRALFGDRYASSDEDVLKLLERAVSEMEALADELAGKARKATPSPRTPVNVLFIDELAVLSSLVGDRKTAQRIDNAIKRLLYLGRALNFVVVGAIQDPRKDNVDYRDGFPVKVAMKLDKPMVDLVLGAGSYEAGAHCDGIPAGKAGAGVAFVKQEYGELACVRFPWFSDELIAKTSGELAPVLERLRLKQAS